MAAPSHSSPLAALVHDASIGSVSCAGHEILRRIFVTVRDRNWQEVRPSRWSMDVEEPGRCVRMTARHTSEWVDFEWRGTLRVSADMRELRFEFAGTVLRDMQVCRLGLIVLHPVAPMIGADLMMSGLAGTESLKVREQLSPQPIVDGVPGAMGEPFSTLQIERADVGRLQFKFEGDLFELEDQRNWGDASFKTYCTPLRLGFPRALPAGATIKHAVGVSFQPALEIQAVSPRHVPKPVERRFPLLGCVVSSELREARWSHLQIGLSADNAALSGLLAGIPAKMPLELLIDASAKALRPEQCAALRAHAGGIERALIHGPGTTLPASDDVERWRLQLVSVCAKETPLLATTRGYYVEHNRTVPLAARVDGIAFPLTSTVHSDDSRTIVDNVPSIVDMARTARAVAGLNAIAIAPLALYFPARKPPHDFPPALVAPWLIATLIHAAQAGVNSITLADDVLQALGAEQILRGVCDCAGAEVRSLAGSLPPSVHGIVVRRGDGALRGLFANLGQVAATVAAADLAIENFDGRSSLDLAPFGVAAVHCRD
jgi:hypothetical protein